MDWTRPKRLGLLFCGVAGLVSTAYAEDILLDCNMTGRQTESTGAVSRIEERVQVEVQSVPGRLYIEIKGVELNGAALNRNRSAPNGREFRVIDTSNNDKWDIHQTATGGVGSLGDSHTLISIDRRSGHIQYQEHWTARTGRSINVVAVGSCNRASAGAKKF